MKTKAIAGQASWCLASDRVEAAVTLAGGHLGPVKFRLGRKVIEPFSVAPWALEKPEPGLPPILRVLRGDFFCAPFGAGKTPWKGEDHPVHGETANSDWNFEQLRHDEGRSVLHLSLQTQVRKGRIDKFIQLRPGQTALYCRHLLSGMNGKMNLGHHAMLKFPEGGKSFISTSRIRFGQVLPETFEEAAKGGYSSLKPGATFSRLDRVPAAVPGFADLSSYPARRGFEDLAMVAHWDKIDFAWTAVTFPEEGYVWFSLKDPRILQSTVFWISNGGRHYPPWNSRHVNVMGIEDVTSYFHLGLGASCRPNPWNRRGYSTALSLDSKEPLAVSYIMGVAKIPPHFLRVKKILPGENGITLISNAGQKVKTEIDLSFLQSTQLL